MGDAFEERPGLEEQIGVAVGASKLTLDPEHNESHLVRVVAMGGAANRIALNLDQPRSLVTGVERGDHARLVGHARPQSDTPAPWPWPRGTYDERSVIEARLAPLLWRMKFGVDATPETALTSVRLFARWMAGTRAWREHPVPGELAQRFAARLIYEWLADKCSACGGTGLQELLRNGMARRPTRFGDPDARHVQCRGCQGARRARPDVMGRARALEVSLAEYRAQWAGRMDRAGMMLTAIARRLTKPLHSELEHDYNRA